MLPIGTLCLVLQMDLRSLMFLCSKNDKDGVITASMQSVVRSSSWWQLQGAGKQCWLWRSRCIIRVEICEHSATVSETTPTSMRQTPCIYHCGLLCPTLCLGSCMLIPAVCRGQIHRTNSLVVHMAGTNLDKKKKKKTDLA